MFLFKEHFKEHHLLGFCMCQADSSTEIELTANCSYEQAKGTTHLISTLGDHRDKDE